MSQPGARNRSRGDERENGSAEDEGHRKNQKSEPTRLYQLCLAGLAAGEHRAVHHYHG